MATNQAYGGSTPSKGADILLMDTKYCKKCKTSKLFVDHDHNCCPENGKSCGKCVRGLLCMKCNFTVGTVENCSLQDILAYIEKSSTAVP